MAEAEIIRLFCFAGVFALMALAELITPRRQATVSRPRRWLSNLGLIVLNTIVVRLVLPMGLIGIAEYASAQGWGLLPRVGMPDWASVLLSVILFDLAIYLQHVLFHAVPILWRLHRVHHVDLDFDVTTGLRFHTFEILLSLGIKAAVIVVLGVTPLAVLVFEVLLSATSMFNHANVKLPTWLDRVLRLVLVTPDMHRVHHSVLPEETNSNFGFSLPWWDFLFRTYRAQPALGHEAMVIGQPELRDETRADRLPWMLLLPFLRRGR